MNSENSSRQEHSHPWPVIILVCLVAIVGGLVVVPGIIGKKPTTETVVQQATPVSPVTEAPIETTSRSPHEGVINERITHERVISVPVPTVTPIPEPPVSSPPMGTTTPTLSPTPTSFSLTLQITNPYYGAVSVAPYNPSNLYPKDSTVTLIATAKPGHKFNGWRGDVSSTLNSMTIVMDRDKTINGDFSRLSFSLKVDSVPGGGTISISPNLRSYEYGSTVVVAAKPQAGYTFKSWSGDASGSQNPLTIAMDQDKKIGGTFVKGRYTLTTKVNPSGFIDINPAGGSQDSGAKVTLTARPSPYYRFVSWSGDVSSTTSTITITMDSNKNITANFIMTYTLNTFVNPPGYGTVSPSFGTYDEGTEVTLTAIPISGYEFVEWSGSLSGTNQITRITMNSDKSAAAYFQPIKYP